jgi:hypothetical protein
MVSRRKNTTVKTQLKHANSRSLGCKLRSNVKCVNLEFEDIFMFPYINEDLSGIRTRCSAIMRKKHKLENHSWRGISVQLMNGRMRKQGVRRVGSVSVQLLNFSSGVARLFGARVE